MINLNAIVKGVQLIIHESTKPESFKTGERLENYVEKYLFKKDRYTLVEKTHSYQTNKSNYVESSLKPDFTFREKSKKFEFYLEVKYRDDLFKGKYEWCNASQLKRYQAYHKSKPVFILLATKDNMYLIPLKDAKYTGLYPESIKKFSIDETKEITIERLWKY